MAQESCNLDKDEAEILKPSSSSSPSPSSQTTPPPPPTQPPPPPPPPTPFVSKPREEKSPTEAPETPAIAAAPSPPVFGNRCNVCCKKVGLTGFRCRCGELFCPRHRHSETHDCSFDYKAAGREEIARANPVIRAAKIIKI